MSDSETNTRRYGGPEESQRRRQTHRLLRTRPASLSRLADATDGTLGPTASALRGRGWPQVPSGEQANSVGAGTAAVEGAREGAPQFIADTSASSANRSHAAGNAAVIDEHLLLAKGLPAAAALAEERLLQPASSLIVAGVDSKHTAVMPKRQIACIEIDAFGKSTLCVYARDELIRELRSEPACLGVDHGFSQNKLAPSSLPEVTSTSGALDLDLFHGAGRHIKPWKGKKRTKYGPIQSRDLRLLDPAFSVEPALNVRDHVILAVFDNHIRAAIQSHRLFIFDHESKRARRATEFVVQRLQRVTAEEAVPFEFLALEALLMATCADIELNLTNLEPFIEHELDELGAKLDRGLLERLRADERRLSMLLARARNFERVLEATLNEDEDMSHMYLTEMRCHPEKFRLPTEHEDVEVLLENALQTVQSQSRRMELLDAAINNLEEILEIKLDTSQNRLWSFNIFVHLCVTTFFLSAIPADFFGMNLQIPPEKDTNIFWPWILVVSLNMAMGVAFFVIAMVIFRRRRLLFGLFKRHAD